MMKQPSDAGAINVWKSLSEKKTVLLIRHPGLLLKREKYHDGQTLLPSGDVTWPFVLLDCSLDLCC